MLNLITLWVLPLLFLLSTWITYGYIRLASTKKWIDIPNHRSSHFQATPRGGGIVFIGIWAVCILIGSIIHLWTIRQAFIFLPSIIIVALVGFWDDRYSLSARWRAIAYFIAATISVYAIGGIQQLTIGKNLFIPLGVGGSFIAILAIVWSTNLFNFMDGIDGISAIEAICVLGAGGGFLWQAGGHNIALLTWMLVACVAGFLMWNKPPAKLFMGDVGSASLGFIIMLLAFLGEKQYGVPALLWFILYAVFIYDATITLFRRLLAKEKWYEAHRSHAYQRLHQRGWSHAKVVGYMLIVNVILMGLAVFGFYHYDWMIAAILFSLLILTVLYKKIERLNPMF